MNLMLILLYISQVIGQQKFDHFKNVMKKAIKQFSLRRQNIVPWYLKFVHVLFCVFQTNLNKALNLLCKLSEWNICQSTFLCIPN